jgi:uncharacterized repeat protein (TIGR01451 family)
MMTFVKRSIPGLFVAMLLTALASASPALANVNCPSAGGPWWHLTSSLRPANVPPGGEGTIVVVATNVGDGCTSGPVQVSDVLPAGVTVLENSGQPEVSFFGFFSLQGQTNFESLCETVANRVTCTLPYEPTEPSQFPPQRPYEDLEMRIAVRVGTASGEATAEVTGGGASRVQIKRAIPVSASAPAFGVERYELVPEEQGGAVDAQAGSHPFQLTTTLNLNQGAEEHVPGGDTVQPLAQPRNLQFQLPPGLVGNATAIPKCSDLDFKKIINFENYCSSDTAVGVAVVTFDEPKYGLRTQPFPVFNLAPEHGEPARFGFNVLKTPVILDTSVRSGADYGVTVSVSNISQVADLLGTSVAFWGVPGDPRHDAARGWACLANAIYDVKGEQCISSSQSSPPPFLTLPTSCAVAFSTTVQGESWPFRASPGAEPTSIPLPAARYSLEDGFGRPLGITGCNQLLFEPSIEVAPDVSDASTSTGLKVDVHIPQEAGENAGGLVSSAVKDITVALPQGLAINPSGANGLGACGEGQVGYLAPPASQPPENLHFTPTLPEPLEPGSNLEALGFCPNASKIATVRISSPLIANPVVGSVYLAGQNENPFGSLIAMYIVAEDPVSGTVVKLPGEVHLTEAGQIVTTFKNNPQLPFEDAELRFFGGERAPLSTPARCGPYTTNASFAPWSGNPAVGSTSTFEIKGGPKTVAQPSGSLCPGVTLPFSPSATGGSLNAQAGAFSPLTATFSREDGEQNFQGAEVRLAPGMEGLLTGVKLCNEAAANAGTCGPESLIGETTVSAGVGVDPVSVSGGKVYLTEHYAGAPFGLSIVNPVKAGPFDLEHDTSNPNQQPACDCIVVRATVEVDPHTAALTVTAAPSGPHAIPRVIDGIPVQIKKINVTANRPHFTFNPTNCNALSVTGAATGDEGASILLSVPFQMVNCALLKYEPKFTVRTAARPSKANGASLNFRIAYPKGAMGSQSWFKRAKFAIPRQLPARLTTIQQACLSATFDTDPAACPPHSVIGHAIVHTQVLPVPLEGPVYFVSHGGAKFPDAVLVLQGYGITFDLVGETFINGKTGVTSATFANNPDVPFESIEVIVPQGPFSEFGANLRASAHGSFCRQKLSMPTEFVAQNGLAIHQNTPVGVTGCRKARTRAQKLAGALKACRHKHGHKRAACERAARRVYGARKTKTSKSRRT